MEGEGQRDSKGKGLTTVTVFGSCRVFTPIQILHKAGRLTLGNSEVYGYTHYTTEIIQQIKFISGAVAAPVRLRPYMNIPPRWQPKPPRPVQEIFAATDLFVIEVSSIRVVRYKAMFLQINRVRELLNENLANPEHWVRQIMGRTESTVIPPVDFTDPVKAEVYNGVKIYEQDEAEIVKGLGVLSSMLGKKILFVSHFNTDYECRPIPQRTVIVDALTKFAGKTGHAFFDPTEMVKTAGIKTALKDLGHYNPEFEPVASEALAAAIEAACKGQDGAAALSSGAL